MQTQQSDLIIEWAVDDSGYDFKVADRSVKDAIFLVRNQGPGSIVIKTWSGLHQHLTSDDLVLEAHHNRFVWADHGLSIAADEGGAKASGTATFCR